VPWSAYDAEVVAGEHMHWMGFSNCTVAAPGPDGGIDVTADEGIAQVKFWATPVSPKELQRTVGIAAGLGRDALFFAKQYSQASVNWADQAGLALYVFNENGGVSPINAAAEDFEVQGPKGKRKHQSVGRYGPTLPENTTPVLPAKLAARLPNIVEPNPQSKPEPAADFKLEPGAYLVGSEIEPGMYRIWSQWVGAQTVDKSGEILTIVASDRNAMIRIEPTDFAFVLDEAARMELIGV